MVMETESEEIWKPIEGFDCIYMVSNRGRVIAAERIFNGPSGKKQHKRQRFMAQYNGGQSLYVQLLKNGRLKHPFVQSLVANAFLGPIPAGCRLIHKDGNKHNNCLENLEYQLHEKSARIQPSITVQ
jgi:hypothetical protein